MAIYSDLNQYTPTKKTKLTDIETIYQSIHNILATQKGERIFLPEFGSNLEGILFEPMDDITTFAIFNEVIDAIGRWEPRVNILMGQSSVTPSYDDNKYDVVIAFSVVGLEGSRFEYSAELARTLNRE